MAVVTQQMADELLQRMADLNVRGTYCPAGYLVFSSAASSVDISLLI